MVKKIKILLTPNPVSNNSYHHESRLSNSSIISADTAAPCFSWEGPQFGPSLKATPLSHRTGSRQTVLIFAVLFSGKNCSPKAALRCTSVYLLARRCPEHHLKYKLLGSSLLSVQSNERTTFLLPSYRNKDSCITGKV